MYISLDLMLMKHNPFPAFNRLTLLFVAVLTLCACSHAKALTGTFVCVSMGHGHDSNYIGQPGDTMEFRQDGNVYMPPVLAKYTSDKDKVTITYQVMGTTLVYVGRIEGDKLTFDYDGSVWSRK